MLRRFANNAVLSKSLRLCPIQIAWPLYLAQRRKSNFKLDDKVVIVTGAGLGIGAATCIAYSHEGSNIVLADLNQENLDKIARICEENCAKTLCVKTDVTQEDQLKELVRATIEKFGKIDVLVNNAGILTFGSLIKGDVLSSYDKVLAVNLRACVQLTMLSAQHLLKTKGKPYCISKAGLDHFMFGAALEFAPHGVRVNNICPGPTKTEIFEKAGVKGDLKDIAQSFKLGEMSEPGEVADLIVYMSQSKCIIRRITLPPAVIKSRAVMYYGGLTISWIVIAIRSTLWRLTFSRIAYCRVTM